MDQENTTQPEQATEQPPRPTRRVLEFGQRFGSRVGEKLTGALPSREAVMTRLGQQYAELQQSFRRYLSGEETCPVKNPERSAATAIELTQRIGCWFAPDEALVGGPEPLYQRDDSRPFPRIKVFSRWNGQRRINYFAYALSEEVGCCYTTLHECRSDIAQRITQMLALLGLGVMTAPIDESPFIVTLLVPKEPQSGKIDAAREHALPTDAS